MQIDVVTPFPLNTEPFRGASIYYHLAHMQKWCDVKVYVPHPRYPPIGWLQPRTFLYQREGFAHPTPALEPEFVEYPALPLLSRPINGHALANKIAQKLRVRRPDLILSYCVYPDGCAAVMAARSKGIPVIVGCLGSDVRRISDPLSRQMVRYTLRNADFVLGVSKELIARAIDLGASPQRTRVISLGCEASVFFPADRADARSQLGLAPDVQLIVFTGRFVALKGVQELLAAFFRMAASLPNLQLACVGDGPLRPTYQQKAESDFRGRVHFLGNVPQDRVALWLAASDVFCLPSHSEGSPNAVIEALSCGRPVVATDVGGIPDLVDPQCGMLVPAHDSNALESALRHALNRVWDFNAIASMYRRTWLDMALDTFEVCKAVHARATGSHAVEELIGSGL